MAFIYDYTPKLCEGDDALFDGTIKLKGLHFEKKMELLETMEKEGIGLGELAKLAEDTKVDPMKGIRIMHRFVVLTKEQWESCAIKDKKTGTELKSYDDVASFPLAHPILQEVALHIVTGGLGK